MNGNLCFVCQSLLFSRYCVRYCDRHTVNMDCSAPHYYDYCHHLHAIWIMFSNCHMSVPLTIPKWSKNHNVLWYRKWLYWFTRSRMSKDIFTDLGKVLSNNLSCCTYRWRLNICKNQFLRTCMYFCSKCLHLLFLHLFFYKCYRLLGDSIPDCKSGWRE